MSDETELARLRGELDELRAQLVRSEKLATLGSLAAGVAHELNNPIGFVKNNMTMLGEYMNELVPAMRASLADPGGDLAATIDDIGPLMEDTREGIHRIAEIVAGLRGFARLDVSDVEHFDLNQCVADTLKVAAYELKYKAKVVQDLGDIPSLAGRPGEVNQVILNLLVNAAQAIPEFGEIRILTRRQGDEVELLVADDGPGIAPEHMQQLFTPFFTTKAVGKGTGLGLSISHDIVAAHGGRIEVTSGQPKGAEFRVFLPVSREGTHDSNT